MCIVIDTNRAADFARQEEPYLKLLMTWINSGGKVISGGRLEAELFKVEKMRGLLTEWSKRGSLIRIPSPKIEAREAMVAPMCKSNDAHVIAVAIEGRADIVVTEDNILISDIKNRAIGGKFRALKSPKFNPNDISRQRKLLNSTDC